jgi:AcrR family transcriptional regulator
VLDAALDLFAERGFERTTMRAVGTRAGVDPALIYHYFGDKDGLLAAVVKPPVDLAGMLAGIGDDPGIRERMVAILRTGLSNDHAARLLRDMLSSWLLGAVGGVMAEDQRELRAALIGSHLGGLMLARHVLKVPGAAAAAQDELVQAVGPTVQRYLTGALTPQEAQSGKRDLRL